MTDSKKEKDPDEMLGANEAGRILGVSGKSVVRFMEDGKFSGYKIGGVWKFKRGEIEQYRDAQRYKPGSSEALDNAA